MPNNSEPSQPPAHPQPVIQCRITAMSDGNVNVNGFPTTLLTFLDLFFAAFKAVIVLFIKQAKAGYLDDNNTIIPKKILTKDNNLVNISGKPLQ